jgi:hypothetical protein
MLPTVTLYAGGATAPTKLAVPSATAPVADNPALRTFPDAEVASDITSPAILIPSTIPSLLEYGGKTGCSGAPPEFDEPAGGTRGGLRYSSLLGLPLPLGPVLASLDFTRTLKN